MKVNKLPAVVIVFLVILAFSAGCGENGGLDDAGGKNVGFADDSAARTIVAKSAEATSDFNNFKAKTVTDVMMSAMGQNIGMKIDADMDIFTDPLKIKMSVVMDSTDVGLVSADSYIVMEEGDLVTYTNVAGAWSKTAKPYSKDLLSLYTNSHYIKVFDKLLKEAVILAEEQVSGTDCWKIGIVVDASASMEILENTQGGMALANMITPEMLEHLDDLTATVWISKADFSQIKMDMDMAPTLAYVMSQRESGISVNKMMISMIITGFGVATDFTLPAEAKNAVEIDE